MSGGLRRLRLAALLVTLALTGLAACGGEDGDSESPDADDAQAAPSEPQQPAPQPQQLPEGIEGFVACPQDNGVDITMEDLTGGTAPPINPQDPTFQQALAACQSKLPQGIGPGG